jgi:hypothetical protein
MASRYHIILPDPERTRASGEFAFVSQGPDGFAAELQDALRGTGLFERWRATQEDPDEVDPSLGVTDPTATVTGHQDRLQIGLTAVTSLPGEVFKHRLRLLAGSSWQLRDVSAA